MKKTNLRNLVTAYLAAKDQLDEARKAEQAIALALGENLFAQHPSGEWDDERVVHIGDRVLTVVRVLDEDGVAYDVHSTSSINLD